MPSRNSCKSSNEGQNEKPFYVLTNIEYACSFKYDPKRPRKLLLKHTEISRITGMIKRDGYAIVVSKLYDNKRGFLKIELALVTGKKKYDKRQYIREKDERREMRTKFKE